MTPVAIAEMLERYADLVIRLPSVSRTNPHVAMEAKSELRGEMIAEAKRLRTMSTAAGDASDDRASRPSRRAPARSGAARFRS